MPDPLAVRLANRFRDALRAYEAVQTAEMARRWLAVEDALEGRIVALAEDVAARREAGEEVTPARLYRLTRYRVLLAQTGAQIRRFGGDAEDLIDRTQRLVAGRGAQDALALVQAVARDAGVRSIRVDVMGLNAAAVENIVALARAGRPLSELLEAAYPLAAQAITDRLVEGTALGWNPRETARIVRRDGLSAGLQHVLLVARDQQNRAYRTASLQQYRQSGVVTGYRRLAAKNDRTCAACLALDGREYPTDELMPLHPQDRCTMVPTVRGLPPVQYETGEAWFTRQPEAVQREILGPGRYEAWQAGRFAFEELASVRENDVWGASAQVTPLRELVG
jgi:SPP1 gp7 family putative phage head morphogenesis protein